MISKFFEFVRHRYHPLHRLRKSRFFRERILPVMDRDVAVQGGFARKIYVKAITHGSFYLASGALEPRIKSLFLALLEKVPANSAFYDVGANIGLYTWLAAGARTDLKIVAFEPDPENFRLLSKTARAWKSPNVHLRQMGLSDVCGEATFQRDTITSATGSLEQAESFAERHFKAHGDRIRVPITTIDSVAAQEGLPAIIKIDVEGHEPKVFAGAWNAIQKARPVIFFESFIPNPPFLSRLTDLQYVLFDADHGGRSHEQTANYVVVPSDSALEPVVRKHLLPPDL